MTIRVVVITMYRHTSRVTDEKDGRCTPLLEKERVDCKVQQTCSKNAQTVDCTRLTVVNFPSV